MVSCADQVCESPLRREGAPRALRGTRSSPLPEEEGMATRTNLLALAVALAGAAALATPRPLHATWLNPVPLSCCRAVGPFGELIRCCSFTGCMININGCTTLT